MQIIPNSPNDRKPSDNSLASLEELRPTAIERVLSLLDGPQGSGQCLCPAHDDTKPSLAVWENDDGSVGIHCYAGCEKNEVLKALGLTWRDLKSVKQDSVATKLMNRKPKPDISSPSPPKNKSERIRTKLFDSSKEAIEFLSRGFCKQPSKKWPYHDRSGKIVSWILRWETPEGKEIRPISREENGWKIGSSPTRRQLYRLPEVINATQVFVCEGEKACDAIRSLGFAATTSPHGALSANNADWTPLAGKEVIILPDNDVPGHKYAESVRDILSTLAPRPVIKVVAFKGLPNGGDAFDWVAAFREKGREDKQLRFSLLIEAIKALPFVDNPKDEAEAEENEKGWVPFPLEVLPDQIRKIVIRLSRTFDVDPSFVILPLLSVFASAIGNTTRIQLKRGYSEPSCLWMVIVALSGDGKSPPLEFALKFVHKVQLAWAKIYEDEFLIYEAELDAWNKDEKRDPSEKPKEPIQRRLLVDDSTVEALAAILAVNDRGLLLGKDELSGLFASFDRYASSKGGDASKYLEMHGGRPITVDRRGNKRPLLIQRALLSIIGGIQPEILKRFLKLEYLASGLAARILFVLPPRNLREWINEGVSEKDEKFIDQVLNRLLELEFSTDQSGNKNPKLIPLSNAALRVWVKFYNEHAKTVYSSSGDLNAAFSKLFGYAARFALVIHFLRWASGDSSLQSIDQIDETSMNAAIILARWFGHETERVYSRLFEPENEKAERELLDWIRCQGKPVTIRDVTRGLRRYRKNPNLAHQHLTDLVKRGFGSWVNSTTDGKNGGRPASYFQLKVSGDGDNGDKTSPSQ